MASTIIWVNSECNISMFFNISFNKFPFNFLFCFKKITKSRSKEFLYCVDHNLFVSNGMCNTLDTQFKFGYSTKSKYDEKIKKKLQFRNSKSNSIKLMNEKKSLRNKIIDIYALLAGRVQFFVVNHFKCILYGQFTAACSHQFWLQLSGADRLRVFAHILTFSATHVWNYILL